jgi:hypothetical protein
MSRRVSVRPRIACAALMLLALAAFASACESEEEAASSPTPTAVGATLSPTSMPEPPTAVPTPEPTATSAPAPVLQPEWSIREETVGAQLHVLLEDGLSPDAYLVAAVDPELAEFEQWGVDRTVDADGDGREEAIVFHYTGGAHCCSEYAVFASGDDGIELLDTFSLGNAGINDVQDLDGDGVPELIAGDDRLAYFDDLPYAVSPFLPLVLCRSPDGTYHDCTPDFPTFLTDNATDYEETLRQAVAEGRYEEEQRSAALALYFSYLRLGMAAEGESRVTALCPDCWRWLTGYAGEVDRLLAVEQPFRE